MITFLIILLLIVGLLLAASVALGRQSVEVESARDTEYLELDGIWIRYRVIGGGPPVLLVHGWLSSSSIWDGLEGRLAQRFTVYTLDLTGFGESDKPLSGYGVRNGSRLLYAFCAHFGLTRTSVVAHDLGGNMAVKLAADHPDVVGNLILVAVPANEEQIDLPTPLWLATLPVVGPLFYALGRSVRPVREMWMKPFVSEPEDLPEDVVEDAAQSTPAAVRTSLNTTRREISGGRLARQARILKGPMFLIAGEEDQIVDPQSVGTWSGIADTAEVALIEQCGHLPMLERPSEFNAHVLAFLTGDARYLDLIERPAPEDDEHVEDEHAEDEYTEEEFRGEERRDEEFDDERISVQRMDRDSRNRDDFKDEPVWREARDEQEPITDEQPTREPIGEPDYESRPLPRSRSFDPQPPENENEDETTDLSSSLEDDAPVVRRKRQGEYVRDDASEESDENQPSGFDSDGYENGSRQGERESKQREPFERGPLDRKLIPELPDDLFEWSSSRRENPQSSRRRDTPSDSTERPPSGNEEPDGDDPQESPRP